MSSYIFCLTGCVFFFYFFFFFKQKTAYEMRISDWSSDVCSSDLVNGLGYAVMMMTPAALTEFATGFMLTERLADTAADLHDIDIAETPAGIILRGKLGRASCRERVCQYV